METNKARIMELADQLGGVPVVGLSDPRSGEGVRYGDIILQLNGERTRTLGDLMRARQRGGAQQHLVIMRDGREVRLTIVSKPFLRPTRPAAVVNGDVASFDARKAS